MREVYLFTFRARVMGAEKTISGKGIDHFEADRNATVKIMRDTGAKCDQVEVL